MNKLKKRIENIGLSFKKEITILIIINLVLISCSIACFILFKQAMILAFLLFAIILLNYFYLSRYKNIENNVEIKIKDEFVSLLPFFKTYINNGFNIYNTFVEIKNFSSERLSERITSLIAEIDVDKTIKPYHSFAKKFNDNEIEQLMICVYQMVDDGNNERYINQFETIFSKLRDEKYQNNIESKDKSLSSMSVFPLIGSALLIVMITFGILSTIGDLINGI